MRIFENRSYKKIAAGCLISMAMAAAGFGGTWAYYNSSMSIQNPLKTGSSSVAIVEDYNPSSSFLPGETAVKKVAFQNTGDMDVYLRVKVPPEEGWYYRETIEGVNGAEKGAKSSFHSTERVIKKYTEAWEAEWQRYGDYMYYRRILRAAQKPPQVDADVTKDILESITLDPEVTNDRHKLDYSNMLYKLTFEAEAVPVYGEENDGYGDEQTGIKDAWGMKVTEGSDGLLIWSSIEQDSGN